MKKENENTGSFIYSMTSTKPPEKIFSILLDVNKWWSGFHEEIITGKSSEVNDEFFFRAGGGAHFSKQKLTELEPNEKIVWLVTESNLTFLDDTNEWTNTKIRFDIEKKGETTTVTFTHEGLIPEFECYKTCSTAWSEYLAKLKIILN
jgi:hypothetical protein